MRALDQVLREQVAPVLRDAGFTRRGRLFWMGSPAGDRAFVWFSPFKLGGRDAEFFVDVGIVPAIYADFITRDGDAAVTTNAGLWARRLDVPGKQGLFGRDLWSFDVGDAAATGQLAAVIREAVAQVVRLLDPVILLAHIRDTSTRPQEIRLPRQNAITLLLANQGPSEELDQRLVALEQPGSDPSGALAWFIRERVARTDGG